MVIYGKPALTKMQDFTWKSTSEIPFASPFDNRENSPLSFVITAQF